MSNNSLYGSIPSSLGALTGLTYLGLNDNALTGSIPSSLGTLTGLTYLILDSNSLSSRIPPSLGVLNALTFMILFNNRLTGSLNASELPGHLKFLDFNHNVGIRGAMPSLDGLPNLKHLNLAHCGLTGTLPPLLTPQLTLLDISYNSIRGSLPSSLWSLRGLQELYLAGNGFDGTLSGAIGSLTSLKTFSIVDNKLSSSLPFELGNLTSIETLDLSRNSFELQIPSSLTQLKHLRSLLLGGNKKLTSLGLDFLDPRRQLKLECIDVSSNNLRGVIDGGLFRNFKALRVLSAGSNCFQMTSLPSEICLAGSLRTLVLDGMTSGDACKQNFWMEALRQPFKLTGTYSKFLIESPLPSCLLSDLRNLETLHLSGLGLRGTIPDVHFSPSLRDLTLSNNKLSGPLPSYLQRNLSQFSSVDLSNNRISGEFLGQVCRLGCSYKQGGVCTSDVPTSQSSCFVALNLAVNRLSGLLPKTIDNAAKPISILEGNFFTCNVLTQGPLPKQDPFFNNFTCGSNLFETAFAIWLMVLALGALLFVRKEIQERKKFKEESEVGSEQQQQYLTWHEFFDILAKAVEAECHPQAVEVEILGRKLSVHKLLVVIAASIVRLQAPVIPSLRPSLLSLDKADFSRDSRAISLRADSLRLSNHTDENGRPSSIRDDISTRLSATEAESVTDPPFEPLETQGQQATRVLRCSIGISRLLESMNELLALVGVGMLLFIGLMIVYGASTASTGMLHDAYAWATTTAFRSGLGCAVAYLIMWSLCLLGFTSLVLRQRRNRGLTFGPMRKPNFLSELNRRGAVESSVVVAEKQALNLLAAQRKLDPEFMLPPSSPGARFNDLVDPEDLTEEALKLDGWDWALGRMWSKHYIGAFLVLRTVFVTGINITVVFAVNSAYVAATVKETLSLQYGLKALLVVFLLVWNKIVIPSMLHSKNSFFGAFFRLGMTIERVDAFTLKWLGGTSFDVVLLTINSVVAPTFAAMSTSSNCFRGALRQEREVRTSFVLQYMSLNTTMSDIRDSSFTPSFIYSYTCSSLLVTLYSPIYIGVALWTTCMVPIIGHVVARIESEKKEPDGTLKSRGRKLRIRRYYVQSVSDFLILLTVGVICPLVGLAVGTGIIARTLILQYRIVTCLIGQVDDHGVKMVSLFPGEESVVRMIISVKTFLQSRCSSCAAAFQKCMGPLFAWISGKCFASNRKKSARAPRLSKHSTAHSVESAFQKLELDAIKTLRGTASEGHSDSPLYRSRFVLYYFPPLFLGLFVYDIAGDKQGHEHAIWGPILMTLVTWVLFGASEFYDRYGAACTSAESSGSINPDGDIKVYSNPLHGALPDSAQPVRARTRTHFEEFRPDDAPSRLSPRHHHHSASRLSGLAAGNDVEKEVELGPIE